MAKTVGPESLIRQIRQIGITAHVFADTFVHFEVDTSLPGLRVGAVEISQDRVEESAGILEV
ncbi:MAG: hypothetical protein KGL39_53080 [Patescibacteria group bacterium]|nr:hypothetical protein [Patescibacteria group bacterium]